MTDDLGGKPVSWNPPADWEKRAGKIAAFLKARQPDVRGIGLAGDYALGTPWDAAVLTVVVFFPDWQPDYTLGALQSMEDMPAALDWVTTGYFVELDRIFDDDERAHRLATLQPLAMYDRVLRDVLTDFRDRYFSREERTARVDRLLALARACAARCADGLRSRGRGGGLSARLRPRPLPPRGRAAQFAPYVGPLPRRGPRQAPP